MLGMRWLINIFDIIDILTNQFSDESNDLLRRDRFGDKSAHNLILAFLWLCSDVDKLIAINRLTQRILYSITLIYD